MELIKYKFRWSDFDANMHIKNTAYNDLFIEARLELLKSIGFGFSEFKKLGIGPMVLNEHLFYLKEIRNQEEVYMDMKLRGSSEDGRFTLFSQYMFDHKGDLACYLDLSFAWLDVVERRIKTPPVALIEGLQRLEKTEDYKIIESKDLKPSHVPYGLSIQV